MLTVHYRDIEQHVHALWALCNGRPYGYIGFSYFQEVQMLREAIYPSLLCAAARAGNMESLEKLKKSVRFIKNAT